MFRHRHGFDLFTDRERYHAVLCNSHLILAATRQESRRGIEEFAPVVHDTALAIMSADAGGMAEPASQAPARGPCRPADSCGRRVNTRTEHVHSLLHCHFESALRALAVARPSEPERLRPVFDSPGYARGATPAEKLSLLDRQVGRLAYDQDIFTRDVFAEVVRKLTAEMTSSGIRHIDLRVGVLMHRWPWTGSLADAIRAFKRVRCAERADAAGPDRADFPAPVRCSPACGQAAVAGGSGGADG